MRVSLPVSLLAFGLALVATGCASNRPRAVPAVTGQRLDVAEDRLDDAGLHYRTAGGGTFGIVVRSHWLVCSQSPPPHRIASSVLLVVARTCFVPDVVGESLEDAEDELERAGITPREHRLDGGPILVDSAWDVCRQSPRAGLPAQPVDLYVSHDCWWEEDG
jgi:hypothetical protein